MAQNLIKTHGDTKPVFAIDQLGGSGAVATGVPVQIAGPKLEFFSIDLGGELYTSANDNQLGTNGAVEKVIQCITQLATVHFYQVDASGAMSVAVYPVGAWSASSGSAAPLGNNLQATIRALTVPSFGTNSSYDLASPGATVANNGFKLA
jgi:hypothetical protein